MQSRARLLFIRLAFFVFSVPVCPLGYRTVLGGPELADPLPGQKRAHPAVIATCHHGRGLGCQLFFASRWIDEPSATCAEADFKPVVRPATQNKNLGCARFNIVNNHFASA